MREVPLSTIPLVFPEEYDPTETLSRVICQYFGCSSFTHVISPLNLDLSIVKKGASEGNEKIIDEHL